MFYRYQLLTFRDKLRWLIKKLTRLYHPDNWNSTEVLSKFESEENFKELAIIYEDIIENVCFY